MNIIDIIGPVMIGPSSSHTAGAVRLGLLAAGILGAPPVKARLICTAALRIPTAGTARMWRF